VVSHPDRAYVSEARFRVRTDYYSKPNFKKTNSKKKLSRSPGLAFVESVMHPPISRHRGQGHRGGESYRFIEIGLKEVYNSLLTFVYFTVIRGRTRVLNVSCNVRKTNKLNQDHNTPCGIQFKINRLELRTFQLTLDSSFEECFTGFA